MEYTAKRKIVITGGPCSGKTSLIRELAKLGYTVVEEAATQIISEGIYHPQKDPLAFQREVVARQFDWEKEAESKTKDLIFCDRGIYDGLAYLRFYNVPESKLYLPEEWGYLMAFHLAQLRFEKDQIRCETPEEASEISRLLRQSYIEKEIPLEAVLVINVAQRAKFVLQKINTIERIKRKMRENE